jgi:hypothetical protein
MTPEDLAAFIIRHADDIYVRHQEGEHWVTKALSELPVKQALAHAFDFLITGSVPMGGVVRDREPKP